MPQKLAFWGVDDPLSITKDEWIKSYYAPTDREGIDAESSLPFFSPYPDLLTLYDYYVLPWLPDNEKILSVYCKNHPVVSWLTYTTNTYLPTHISSQINPCQFVDSLVALLVACCLLTLVYFVCFFSFNLFLGGGYRKLNNSRKWYVVANLTKGFLLGIISISPRWLDWVYRVFILNEYSWKMLHFHLKRSVAIYSVNDIVSLILVPDLPRTTIIHHIISDALCMAIMLFDAGPGATTTLMGFYGACSSLAFGVNLFLGLRFVMPRNSRGVNIFALFALILYVLCCCINWTWHALWLINKLVNNTWTIGAIIYYLLLIFIMRDDFILMGWLWQRAKNFLTGAKFKKDKSEENLDKEKSE